jgi:hypothetical protein
MTPRKPRKTVNASPNPALTPNADTLKVGDGTAAPPAAPRERKRPPFGSYLDADLQKRFKATCVMEGIEMQDGLEDAIRLWLQQRNALD